MDLEEIGINAGNWVDSAQDRNYWRALVNAALKALLPSSILATCPAHLNLLGLFTLTILGEGTHYEVPHCGAFSNPHSHPSWAQVFASSSEDKFIVVPSKWSRCLTAPQVHPEVKKSQSKPVSLTKVKRQLRDAKLFGRVAVRKPLLRPQNKKKQMQWALTHLVWIKDFKKVLWTDESKFKII